MAWINKNARGHTVACCLRGIPHPTDLEWIEVPDDDPEAQVIRPGSDDPWSRDPLLRIVRAGREIALNRLAGIGFVARENHDNALVLAVMDARQALLDITKVPAVLAATDDASLTAAVGAAYAAIIAAAPVEIRNAFVEMQS